MIKTSIIMPIYNPNSDYLKQAIMSALNQNIADLEIIAVDDGSTNQDYFDVINEIKKQDRRLKFFQKRHEFSGIARNVGIAASIGETIMFLDCDDYYLNEYEINTLYNILKEKNMFVAGGKNFVVEPDGTLREGYFNYGNVNDYFCNRIVKFEEYQFPFGFWNFMYNSRFIKNNKLFFQNNKRYQDPIWLTKTLHCAKEFYATNKTVLIHREMKNLEQFDEESLLSHTDGISQLLRYSDEQGYDRMHNLLYQLFYSFDINLLTHISEEQRNTILEKIQQNTNENKIKTSIY